MLDRSESGRISNGAILALVILGAAGVWVWQSIAVPRRDAERFETMLKTFSELKRPVGPATTVGDPTPSRHGKVVVIVPSIYNTTLDKTFPPRMHGAYFKLPGSIRAGNVEELGTVILIVREFVGSDLYENSQDGRLKAGSFHRDYLQAFEWPSKKFLGSRVFDPGPGKETMTEAALDAAADATSDQTVADYIEAMPAK